jgi:FlaA1/EpsC-like NDP-sugar epimerase
LEFAQVKKIHEEMITIADAPMTVDAGKYYIILPDNYRYSFSEFSEKVGGERVNDNFRYNSGENEHFLSIEQLRELLAAKLDINPF